MSATNSDQTTRSTTSPTRPDNATQPTVTVSPGGVPFVFRFRLPTTFIHPIPVPQQQQPTTPTQSASSQSSPAPSSGEAPNNSNNSNATNSEGNNAGNDSFAQLRFTLFLEMPIVIGGGAFSLDGAALPNVALNDFLNYTFLMQQQQRSGSPPASKSAIDRLEEITVSSSHKQTQVQCSVCQEELDIGECAVGLPCDHLYHRDCITPWLKEHNTCPTCRYELPTDDAEFEKGRIERMKKRDSKRQRPALAEASGHHFHRCELGRMRNEDCVLLGERHDGDSEDSYSVRLECGHAFHCECLESWCNVVGKGRCPSCRKPVAFPDSTSIRNKKRRVDGQVKDKLPCASSTSAPMNVEQRSTGAPVMAIKEGLDLSSSTELMESPVAPEPEARRSLSQGKMVEESSECTYAPTD